MIIRFNLVSKILFIILFIVSTMYASESKPTKEEIAKLYIASFNRAPDSDGLNYWLNSSNLTLSQIAKSFFDQVETNKIYPIGTSNIDFITAVYVNLFGRVPDTEGLNYWNEKINNGEVLKNNFIISVINGAKNTESSHDIDILNNKTIVGLSFSEFGKKDLKEANNIMKGITADSNTVNDNVKKFGIPLYSSENIPLVITEKKYTEDYLSEDILLNSTTSLLTKEKIKLSLTIDPININNEIFSLTGHFITQQDTTNYLISVEINETIYDAKNNKDDSWYFSNQNIKKLNLDDNITVFIDDGNGNKFSIKQKLSNTKNLFVSLNTVFDSSDDKGSINNPFKSLYKAIEKANDLKDYSVNILLRAGIYLLDNTIENINSRTIDTPLIIRAYNDENVTILGAKKIINFRKVITSDEAYSLLSTNAKENVIVSNLKELGINNLTEPIYYYNTKIWIYSNELFVGNNKVEFSHYPKDHLLNFLSDGSSQNYTKNHEDDNKTVLYSNNSNEDINTINSWKNEINIYTYARWKYDWYDSRTKVDFIDSNKTIINLHNMPYRGYQKDSINSSYKGLGFYVYNIASELDENSYYIDYKNKTLYYYPKDKDINEKYISYLDNIISIKNSSYITLSNINFSMSKQDAIHVVDSEFINIDNCNINNIGNRAIYLDDVNNSKISNCTLSKLGGAGIYASGGDRNSLTTGNIIISNNNISEIAQTIKYYTAGIKIFGDGNQVIKNNIYNLPHIAIFFKGNNHIIDGNIIHDVVQNAHDAGAIYAGQDWSQRGTVIKNNFLYNIRGENNQGAAGIYLDDLYSGIIVKNNILYNTFRAILIGGGRDNIIDNNFIVNCRLGLHLDARGLKKYDSDETAKIHMGYILNKVPWETKLWQKTYPKLFNIYENNPRLPLGNIISNNQIIETIYPQEYTDDSEQYLDLTNNIFIKKDTYSVKDSNDFNTSKEFQDYLIKLKLELK